MSIFNKKQTSEKEAAINGGGLRLSLIKTLAEQNKEKFLEYNREMDTLYRMFLMSVADETGYVTGFAARMVNIHHAGDEIIRHIGSVLKTEVKGCGYAGRMGGDEFSAFFYNGR